MSVLTDAVKARFGGQILKNLTNDDPTPTTIDDAKLLAVSGDAVNFFEQEAGIPFDETQGQHITICAEGTVAYLERYKGRDVALMDKRWRNFLGALAGYRNKLVPLPGSGASLIRPTKPTQETRPDMDRNRPAFQPKSGFSSIEEVNK